MEPLTARVRRRIMACRAGASTVEQPWLAVAAGDPGPARTTGGAARGESLQVTKKLVPLLGERAPVRASGLPRGGKLSSPTVEACGRLRRFAVGLLGYWLTSFNKNQTAAVLPVRRHVPWPGGAEGAAGGTVVQSINDEGQEAMAKRPTPPSATEEEVRALLERYRCPVPFHEVRTRFLGKVATPLMSASPIKLVEGLWSGQLPEFSSIDEANELIGALIMGLWNQLTQHQKRSAPFRLTRPDVAATREGLATLALIRRQELDGFVEGLFGTEETLDLPERAHRSLNVLGELRSLIAGARDVALDGSKAAGARDIEETLQHMKEMTLIAEHEMHAVVLSCKRARRDMLAALPARKPTLH
jgi:hypothetical protein